MNFWLWADLLLENLFVSQLAGAGSMYVPCFQKLVGYDLFLWGTERLMVLKDTQWSRGHSDWIEINFPVPQTTN